MTYTEQIKLISKKELSNVVSQNKSVASTLKCIGINSRNGGLIKLLDAKIKEYDINTDHFGKPPVFNLEEVLIENSTYHINTLKKRLIKENLLKYECEICGNTGEWNGKPLVLQLDHKNGTNNDNRIENLRFLCPNCHTQTETFAGRNIIK